MKPDRLQHLTPPRKEEKLSMNPLARLTCHPGRAAAQLASLVVLAALVLAVVGVGVASADFGLEKADVTFTNEDGSPATQAGSHPYAVTTSFGINYTEPEFFNWIPDGEIKNLITEAPPGLVGDVNAVPRCSLGDFLSNGAETGCALDSAIGIVGPRLFAPQVYLQFPVYNLEPPPGVSVRLAFQVLLVPAMIDITVKQSGEYNVEAVLGNAPQVLTVFGGSLQLWGDPADPRHDHFRGLCGQDEFGGESEPGTEVEFHPGFYSGPGGEGCPVEPLKRPFLTLPRSCTGPATTVFRAEPWDEPGAWFETSALTHDDAEPPSPQGLTGCGRLPFEPSLEAKPSTRSTESGTGLDFRLDFNDEGLTSTTGIAQSDVKKTVVTLPKGVTVNPSVGEGLGVCTPADFNREKIDTSPGSGCPDSSKIGTLRVETPLLDQPVDGELFLAQQDDPTTTEPGAENPFDSLLAMYMVLRNPQRGIFVKIPAKIEPDPTTGQLVTTVDNVPQLPFSSFQLHFREGLRAPLVSPPTCGSYATEAKLYPWSEPDNPRTVTSTFEISEGIDGGPCPPGGVPPFNPDFEAGSINNNAASFSPFNMRLIREDGEQDMTKFSAVLPRGVLGSLSGVGKCPDSAIAVAKAKTGRQEQARPSCPASSEIGHTLAGAGVGSALTYVPGKIYLGGPYHGDPLSVISITPAVAGPFDAGTVVVQLALTLNPKTAEVEVDGAASDPIPHILKGIVLKVRDLRVYVDRPNFILNPTSCDESSARATLFGSNLNVFDPADDVGVDLKTRYQAANCLNLGFHPHLGLKLKGGTRRGGHPGLRAHYRPKAGDANLKGLVVRLPRSAFLDQSHIRTICTRVQFAEKACPKAAQYGYIKAWTPLLEEPLQGPVWLRSSNHKLPDLVFDLHGLVDVEVATRIDSVRGGIRATVEDAPDAPISRVLLNMQGGKKGLIVNSRNLCAKAKRNRASVSGLGHNGKQFAAKPLMQARCGAKRSHASHRRRHKRGIL